MVSNALIVSIILASSALAAAYGLGALWLPMVIVLILGVAWTLGSRAEWFWIAWLMMPLYAIIAALGAWFDLPPIPLVVGLVAALSAWDLDQFLRQLRGVDRAEPECRLKRGHLWRLLAVDGVSLLLAIMAVTVEIELSLALAVALGLAALLGLSRLVGFLRQEMGKHT